MTSQQFRQISILCELDHLETFSKEIFFGRAPSIYDLKYLQDYNTDFLVLFVTIFQP